MKPKFKLNTKIGQIIYDIEVNVRADDSKHLSTSSRKDGIQVEVLKIVFQTPYKIALSNDWITLLDRQKEGSRKDSYYHYLDEINVSLVTKETYFPNGIFGQCYSTLPPEKVIDKIKKEMIKKINSDYGFLRFTDFEAKLNEMSL